MLPVLFCVLALFLQQSLPPAELVLDNVERMLQGVEDYTVTLEGEVAMEGVRVPKIVIEMFVKRPDKVHFASTSFSIVPRMGMALDPSELRKKYDCRTVASIDTGGLRWYKLRLTAKEPETRVQLTFLYVDAERWTIRRLEASPYEGRTLSFDFEYAMVQETYLLPSRVTAMFGTVGGQSEDGPGTPPNAPSPAPQFREMQRMMRSGTIRFVYRDYRVNTGLPDSLFVSPR